MKIDQEKFNSLKQLDRIEFRQKLDLINKRFDFSFNFSFYLGFFIIGFLILLVGLNFYEISLFNIDGGVNEGIDEGAKILESLLNVVLIIFKVSLLLIFIDILFMIIYSILKHKKLSELEEEYFSVEVKK